MSKRHNTTTTRQVIPGDILWLSPWPWTEVSDAPRFDIFSHPVMIWSVDAHAQMVCVLVVSSLGGKDLIAYKPSKRDRPLRAVHLPIHPSPAHPDSGELLFLHGNLELRRNSYIKTRTRYCMPLSLLRLDYRNIKSGQQFRLRQDSLAKVRKAVDVTIPIEDGMALRKDPTIKIPTPMKKRRRQLQSGWKHWLLSCIFALLKRLFFVIMVLWSLDWLIGNHLLAKTATRLMCGLLNQKCAWAH